MFETVFSCVTDFSTGYWNNMGRGLLIGFLLLLLYIGVWLAAVAWNYAWAWIDEAPPKKHNYLSCLIAKITGWEPAGDFSSYMWRSQRWGQTDLIHLGPMLVLFVGPMVLITLLTFYSLTLTVIVSFAFAHLTRYIRRMKKAFDKHVLDKDAHKEDS